MKKLAHLGLRLWLRVYHRYKVMGRVKLDRPSLIIANHASHIDIAAMLAAIPLKEIPHVRVAAAQDVIFSYPRPIVGLLKFLFNVFPFERDGSTKSLERCARYLRCGYHVIIFPEGRRSQDGRFLGFTPGFASVAYKTGAPIVPLRITGAQLALRRGTVVPLPRALVVEVCPTLAADTAVPWDDRRRAYSELVERANRAVG